MMYSHCQFADMRFLGLSVVGTTPRHGGGNGCGRMKEAGVIEKRGDKMTGKTR
jgi:hypothetical protein